MSKSLLFHNFLFITLEPLLSCRDYISLARCNRYFWKQSNTKHVIFKKFKKQVIRYLQSYETPKFKIPDFIKTCLNHRVVLSGSFALCVFNGETYNNDIDFFYYSNDNIKIPLENSGSYNVNSYYGTIPYYIKNIAHYNIKDNLMENDNNNLPYLQFIQIKPDQYLENESNNINININNINNIMDYDNWKEINEENSDEKENKISTIDFNIKKEIDDINHILPNIILNNFDLDFCKFIFDFQYLEVFNIDSLIYKKSDFKPSSTLFKSLKNIDSNFLRKSIERINKYTERGFTIPNQDFIKRMYSIQQAFLIVERNHEDQERDKKRKKQKLEQEEKELKEKEENKRKSIQIAMIKYLYEEDESLSDDDDAKESELEIKTKTKNKTFTNFYDDNFSCNNVLTSNLTSNLIPNLIPLSPPRIPRPQKKNYTHQKRKEHILWKKNNNLGVFYRVCYENRELLNSWIPPRSWYIIFCLLGKNNFLSECFDINLIPFEWVSSIESKVKRYYEGTLPHYRFTDRGFEKYFWKYVYSTWPEHQRSF